MQQPQSTRTLHGAVVFALIRGLALAAVGCNPATSSSDPQSTQTAAGRDASGTPSSESSTLPGSPSQGRPSEVAGDAAREAAAGSAAPIATMAMSVMAQAGASASGAASSPVLQTAGVSAMPPPNAGTAAGSPSAAAAGMGGATSANVPLTVYIAGDSTVSTYADTPSPNDQAGWGQMLASYVRDTVQIENRAIGGRTARHFIDDGKLAEVWDDIQPGDYLLVQFGTNDGNKTATYTRNGQTIPYYLDPSTDFKTYLKQYIDGARKRGATPVLVTPPPRNSAYCTGGNGTGAHAQAMRELGASEGVIVSDLNELSVTYLKAICPAPDPPDFFLQKPDGSVDGTHFQERGARKLAELVASGLRAAGVPFLRDKP